MVQFALTKSGKNRAVPISDNLHSELMSIARTSQTGRLFKSSSAAFRNAIKRSGIQLPEGQLTHVLRHTFASHFMMNGGNILTLQRILGHSSLAMTMKYAHLAPEHLQEALRLNPLARLENESIRVAMESVCAISNSK
jgi:integrase